MNSLNSYLLKLITMNISRYNMIETISAGDPGADLGGGGGGSRGSGPPLSYMKNDVMHTVIYACYHSWICKIAHRSSQVGLYRSNQILVHAY